MKLTKLSGLVLLLIGIVAGQSSFAQNMVPDSSFEDTVSVYCGIIQNQSHFNNQFNEWTSPTGASGDIYSTELGTTCYNHVPYGTGLGPVPLKGFQDPRTGSVMAGIFAYTINGLNQREYLQCELLQPMIAGGAYEVRFHVSLGDNCELAVQNLGAYLSTSTINVSNSSPLSFVPQVESSVMLADLNDWMLIQDTIAAVGGEMALIIGNFRDDINTVTQPSGVPSPPQYGAYYFVDDVSVRRVVLTNLERRIVAQPKMAGVLGQSVGNLVLKPVYEDGGESLSLRVYDLNGREVAVEQGESAAWRADQVSEGMYIWHLSWLDPSGLEKEMTGRVLRMH